MKIAIAGKGGVGKTTVSSLITLALKEKGEKPILVIDADPNSNLNIYLGIKYNRTIADIRDSLRTEKIPPNMSKYEFFAMNVEEEIVEKEGIDFIAIGHPEGKECYCAVNNILREFIGKVEKNYPFIIVDNEAGLEHISRQSNGIVDWLIFVSNRDFVSLKAAEKGLKLAEKLKISYKHSMLIINKSDTVTSIEELKVDFIETLPYSKYIEEKSLKGKEIKIPEELKENMFKILDTITENGE